MRVGLVIPPSGFVLDERVFPLLGILKVAAALEADGHVVDVLDLSGDVVNEQGIGRWLSDFKPVRVGITATSPQMPAAFAIGTMLKRHGTPSILGGPHITLGIASARACPRGARIVAQLLDGFDVLVAGDGEYAVHQALHAESQTIIEADTPDSPLFLTAKHLAVSGWPARHLIDLRSYHYSIDGLATTSLIAQLGCPFNCGFCGGRASPAYRRVRLRSSADVVAEVRALHERYGFRGFMFLDDELNVNKALPELLHGLRDLQDTLGVDFAFRGLVKSELFTDEIAREMKAAGFREILSGFESGSDRMLLNMQKHATRDDNVRCVERCRRHGLRIKALMSLGHPGETFETAVETEDFLLETRPDAFDVSVITVYPGTPYHDQAGRVNDDTYLYLAKNGDRLYMQDVDHRLDQPFYKGIPGQYRSYVWTDALSPEGVVANRDAIERTVRTLLHIPWPATPAEIQYEHSMGAR